MKKKPPQVGECFGSWMWALAVVGRGEADEKGRPLLCLILRDEYVPEAVGTLETLGEDFVAKMQSFPPDGGLEG